MEVSVTVSKPSLHPSDKLLGRGYHVGIICHSRQHTASVMQRSYMSLDSSSCSINKLVSYDTDLWPAYGDAHIRTQYRNPIGFSVARKDNDVSGSKEGGDFIG
jgi:hypothetical protein